jgi:hypothetical protein
MFKRDASLRIRFLTSIAGPDFSYRAGEVADLPSATARAFADGEVIIDVDLAAHLNRGILHDVDHGTPCRVERHIPGELNPHRNPSPNRRVNHGTNPELCQAAVSM